ncbi:hypothetical protein EKO27_g8191 [Xylaria grammica]|uniref:Alcohol dehydrogenase-like C-terminal domain-containing protein n=1 Tax=Xylaria grammica TaxID=363999 RepID=A0A439CXR2_9PEZI|nr:hypothetical protein EKO27_g8191 [Xylaria grammica]
MHPNKTLIYREYTPHLPVPGKHLVVESRPFDPEADPPPGGITVKNQYLSDLLNGLGRRRAGCSHNFVDGEQLESALPAMKDFGTIVESGMASQYNKSIEDNYGVKTLMQIVFKRLKVVGFICSDQHLLDKYLTSFGEDMGRWLAEGKIKTREEMMVGMDNAPEAMIRMWQGDKFGKMVLRIDEE